MDRRYELENLQRRSIVMLSPGVNALSREGRCVCAGGDRHPHASKMLGIAAVTVQVDEVRGQIAQ